MTSIESWTPSSLAMHVNTTVLLVGLPRATYVAEVALSPPPNAQTSPTQVLAPSTIIGIMLGSVATCVVLIVLSMKSPGIQRNKEANGVVYRGSTVPPQPPESAI